ncbi:MAG: CYTH and CHAD domain-containing protein [Magnetovibrio sp.]|nr:CYTH and CHAD domain-containing protein [Magnetovibrio sp.]
MHHSSEDSTSGLEIELKFELTAANVRRLMRSSQLKNLQVGRARSKFLQATYYDTPDHKLARRGMSLRVRKEGRVFIQCLKAEAPNGSVTGFARYEWEWLVSGLELDLSILRGDKDLKTHLKGINVKKLIPIYTTDIRRQSRDLHMPDGGVILCEIDQGKVMAAGRETNVFELELEYVSGSHDELLSVANLITNIIPARLSNRTKAYRGHVLFEDKGSPWVTANHPTLSKNATAEDVLRASVLEGLNHLIANEDCVLERNHVEGVHQMRVAVRRMRSVITTYKNLLPKGCFENLAEQLKQTANALGPARDWDVFLGSVLKDVVNGFDKDAGLALMVERAGQKQVEAYQAAEQLIHSPDYAKMLTQILNWVATSAWKKGGKTSAKLSAPATETAKGILSKRHARLLGAGKGLAELSTEQRHALRIAIKKARYAAAFFAELYPTKRTKPYLKALKVLQESLGHLNDLATAEHLMKQLTEGLEGDDLDSLERANGMVQGWYMHAQSLREDDLLKAWKTFSKLKPFW